MKLLVTTSLSAMICAGASFAGGLERGSQTMAPLFEEGRFLEFGTSFGSPKVSGSVGALNSGDMTDSFINFSGAYKADINDTWSYAIFYDQPYGADVTYPSGTGYPFQGSSAELRSHELTGVLQYNLDNGASVFGGIRAQTLEAEAVVANSAPLPVGTYTVEGDRNLAFGYLVGAAYEKPEIALRVALTYRSDVDHDLDTLELGVARSVTEVTTPQSLNLEFQSGVMEDTVVFGSVKWVEWSEFNISPANFPANPLVFYADDRITYTLGVGRRLNETWSLLGAVTYEENTGNLTGNLGPTDGFTAVNLGAIYTKGNMKISGGVRYADIGDATTSVAGGPFGRFNGNSALLGGFRVGFTF
ncbi:MAG: outer membrane protein transport protein [Silicimonas sp.]|nr:outer membrane protein transport protein [Silicimonas sp.]